MDQLIAMLARMKSQDDEEQDETVEQHTVDTIAEKIRTGKPNVIVMTGAGLSVAAGIPDFRSPGTGLYDNLAQYNLPYPQAVFEIDFFKKSPEAFFKLSQELMPNGAKYLPTLSHYFINLLHKKGMLVRNFTQNIDGLEYMTGLPDDKIVAAHGSFHTASDIVTGKAADIKHVKDCISRGEVARSAEGNLVKPDIVFFGENLPARFFACMKSDFQHCDLLIVMGTSLQVHPFASLVDRVDRTTPRVLFNRERVGPFEHGGKRDVSVLGNLEEEILKFADKLGWKEELLEMHRAGNAEIQAKASADSEVAAAIATGGVVPTSGGNKTTDQEKEKPSQTNNTKKSDTVTGSNHEDKDSTSGKKEAAADAKVGKATEESNEAQPKLASAADKKETASSTTEKATAEKEETSSSGKEQ